MQEYFECVQEFGFHFLNTSFSLYIVNHRFCHLTTKPKNWHTVAWPCLSLCLFTGNSSINDERILVTFGIM